MERTIRSADRPLENPDTHILMDGSVTPGTKARSPGQGAAIGAANKAVLRGADPLAEPVSDGSRAGGAGSGAGGGSGPGPGGSVRLKAEKVPIIALAPPDLRSLIAGLIGAAGYFVLALLSLWLSQFDNTLATVWLPNAAAVAFLLRMRLANEAGFLAALAPLSALANFISGTPLEICIVFTIANLCGIVLITWLTRRNCGPAPDLSQISTLARFVLIAGVLGPLVSASIAAIAMGSALFASDAPDEWMRVWDAATSWFLTESVGMIVIIPMALLIGDALATRQIPARATLVEGAALMVCSLVCAMLVFGQNAYPLMFLILPMTFVHAFRLGGIGTALHVALVAAVSTAMTWAGHGPITETTASPTVRLHLIQAFIAANFLTGLPISAVLAGRNRLMQAATESRRELALLADNITDAVLKLNPAGVVTYASPAVRDVLGEEPGALIGRPLKDIMQEDASERIARILQRLYDGKSDKERLTYRRRLDDDDGLAVFIEADGAIAVDPQTGRKQGVILSARDVTERVELELLLTRARRHAEKAANAKSDFLANMSHEIRTPMNGVLGFAELMLQSELDTDQRRHMEMIVESGRSMMLLLNDILDLSKIEAGEIVVDPSPIDLHSALEECVALHRQTAKKKGLSLLLEYEVDDLDAGAAMGSDSARATLLPTVVTDGLRLRQIALNLISNAVKFTENGEVRVSYWANGRELCVRVRDTGIGISPSKLDTIFSPFTQGMETNDHSFGGTGLGLSISRHLAELLGGRIDVESVPGVGSTFTLTLPGALVEAAQPAPATAPATPAPATPVELPHEARILLVEDHDVNRMLVTEMLEKCGQSVAIAHDGNEAIAMVMDSVLRERPYDLVLMDVQMPDCDGYEATRAMREAGINADSLPIIALTANAFPEDVAAAREAGMQAHLAKPLVFAQLAEALQRWLPTRIVEAPMDRDVPLEDGDAPLAPDGPGFDANAPQASSEGRLRDRWIARRLEAIEAIRHGLSDGIIANTKKRRAQDKARRNDVLRLLHKLAGTAGSFGEAELGKQAAALERAMTNHASPDECEALAFELLALADEPAPAPPPAGV
ncbi:MAG: ATP-binding protein [Pseudomonadota bacterium]